MVTTIKQQVQGERSDAAQKVLQQGAMKMISDLLRIGLTFAKTARKADVLRGAPVHHFATRQDFPLTADVFVQGKAEGGMARISRRSESETGKVMRARGAGSDTPLVQA